MPYANDDDFVPVFIIIRTVTA